MELTIRREELLKPLQLVSGAVERRQTLPILSNVLISAKNIENESGISHQLSFTATDLEVELVGRINIDSIEVPGEITVSARKLFDICKTLPEGSDIQFSTNKDRLTVKSGKSRFVLTTLPASEFPNVEESNEKVAFFAPQKELKEVLEKTHFAMALQDVRYYLNGMLFDFSKKEMKLVATDGHRLSLASFPGLELQSQPLQIIVPRKGIIELMRLLQDVDEKIKISLGSNHICASTPEFTFTSKLIEGKFPSYDQVIPKNGNKVVIANRDELKQVLTRVSILSNEQYRGIRILLKPNLLSVFANNPEQEEAEEELQVGYNGSDLEMAFNVNYFIDICNTISSKEMKITFSNSTSCVLIEELGEESNYIYVIMPLRL